MREVSIIGVRVQTPENQPIVLLHEEQGSTYLPIWVGAPEASAIALAQQGVVPPRPLTHDLLLAVLGEFQTELQQVRIVAMVDNVFHAELHLSGDRVLSCRPSDAIALALRAGCKVFVDPHVLDVAGMPVPDDDEVVRFREFLDNVNAEDFAEGDENPER